MNEWQHCKKILVIRADNMGDVIMSTPAIRALKETFKAHITLLTSPMGGVIQGHIAEVDDYILFTVPWIKAPGTLIPAKCFELIEILKAKKFDAAVILTVYSQSALPAAVICVMAGIPLQLAYSRENPYQLLTHWLPDKEPYDFILHQVERDYRLVEFIGATCDNKMLSIKTSATDAEGAQRILEQEGTDILQPFIILHPGVSEAKRRYPVELWTETGTALYSTFKWPLLITGAPAERQLAGDIQHKIGAGAINVAGLLTIGQFIALVKTARLVVTVNTSTVHIAAAMQTPQIVLYALTNPQHIPWQSPAEVLYFPVKEALQSKSPIINYVSRQISTLSATLPSIQQILSAARKLIYGMI